MTRTAATRRLKLARREETGSIVEEQKFPLTAAWCSGAVPGAAASPLLAATRPHPCPRPCPRPCPPSTPGAASTQCVRGAEHPRAVSWPSRPRRQRGPFGVRSQSSAAGGQSGTGAVWGAGGTRARTWARSPERLVLLAPRLLAFSVSLLLLPVADTARREAPEGKAAGAEPRGHRDPAGGAGRGPAGQGPRRHRAPALWKLHLRAS